MLLHDAGGDRSETVAALDRIIPRMLLRGVTFATVSGAVGLPPAEVPASPGGQALGTVMLAAVATARIAIAALQTALVVGSTLVLLRLLVMSGVAIAHSRRCRSRGLRRWSSPVSVVVPAFNEGRTIAATVRSLVAGDHPVEVVVVDDGSTDDTAVIVERLGLPDVRLVRKPNGGKPSALNAGIAASRHDIVVMLDGERRSSRVAGGLRAHRARVDRRSGDVRAAVASALPLELWRHAVVLEAPARRRGARTFGPSGPGRAAAHRTVPDRAAAHRADDRRLSRLRSGLPGPGADHAAVGGRALRPVGGRRDRVSPGGRADARPAPAPGAAAGLPPAHVRGAHPVPDVGSGGHPAALAQSTARGQLQRSSEADAAAHPTVGGAPKRTLPPAPPLEEGAA